MQERAPDFGVPVLAVSATTGEGCGELLSRLSSIFQQAHIGTSAASVALNARHREALHGTAAACRRAHLLIQEHSRIADSAELTALELREASQHLASIVGEVTTEELLGRVFSRFCIGK